MIPQFKRTLPEIMTLLALFKANNLSYNLFKCEHLFEGKNKNLDVLFETEQDYLKAAQLLEQEGFILYLSEKFEKYKKMYVRFKDNFPLAVHLHREVVWHGLKALDKKPIFARQINLTSEIIVPSPEDSLLIHMGHILFENFKIKDKERWLICALLNRGDLNWDYIQTQLQRNGWENSFYKLLKKIKSGKDLKKREVFFHFGRRVLSKPKDFITLVQKIMRKVILKLNPKRKGTLIALIGVNGAGKTTLTNKLIETYRPFTELIGKEISGYYYGWEPFTPWAKGLAWVLRNKKTFRKVAEEYSLNQKINISHEILFVYNYVEYLFRYWFQVYPKLHRGEVVISDRYFYDLYGQYPYAEKSIIIELLIKLFPEPDQIFLLDSPLDIIMTRNKTLINFGYKENIRKVKSKTYLDRQKRTYLKLSLLFKDINILNTKTEINNNLNNIINNSWELVVQNTGES